MNGVLLDISSNSVLFDKNALYQILEQVKKKKAFEELAKDLRTADQAPYVATYKGEPITTSKGSCAADTVAGGSIS